MSHIQWVLPLCNQQLVAILPYGHMAFSRSVNSQLGCRLDFLLEVYDHPLKNWLAIIFRSILIPTNMNGSVCFWLKLERCNICMANRVTPMRGILSAEHADACSIQLPNFAAQRCSNNAVPPPKEKNNMEPPPKKKKNPMVCRCMSSFKREHVSVQAVIFSGYHHPLHPSLGVRGCCRGTWRPVHDDGRFRVHPKKPNHFGESIQVILMKLLLSWVSEVSTV